MHPPLKIRKTSFCVFRQWFHNIIDSPCLIASGFIDHYSYLCISYTGLEEHNLQQWVERLTSLRFCQCNCSHTLRGKFVGNISQLLRSKIGLKICLPLMTFYLHSNFPILRKCTRCQGAQPLCSWCPIPWLAIRNISLCSLRQLFHNFMISFPCLKGIHSSRSLLYKLGQDLWVHWFCDSPCQRSKWKFDLNAQQQQNKFVRSL